MLPEEYDLEQKDILELSNRDYLAGFFLKLGYDISVRHEQTTTALGINDGYLRQQIRHIEQLARFRDDFGLELRVYLVELSSVTSAAAQALVRHFRDREGDYVFVLVKQHDYQEIDFVFLDRFHEDATMKAGQLSLGLADKDALPVGASYKAGGGQARPRVLSVARTRASRVALRVLRRFSITEGDVLAQVEVIRGGYAVAEWSEEFFNNRALFSDYFLSELLPDLGEWREESLDRKSWRALYDDARRELLGKPVPELRERLLLPAFGLLGFVASALDRHKGQDGGEERERQADFILASQESPGTPLALCLSYPWGRNLDSQVGEDHDPLTWRENPGAVVVTLLDQGSADWAIVTNGKIWRLYSAKAHSRATNYYEIDLEETLAIPNREAADANTAFRYFWLFFRASAYVAEEQVIEGGETRRLCFLDDLVRRSELFAHALGEQLKERVFDDIFPHFAQGFVQYARTRRSLEGVEGRESSVEEEISDTRLEEFFNGTLAFLYRLLFLLYAESRDLLPVREQHGYYAVSLQALKTQIAERARTIKDEAPDRIRGAYSTHSTALYDQLQTLFRAVDKGSPELNVPIYNGGLFMTEPLADDDAPEARVARFLATHKIPDQYLALGLDRMARDLDEKRKELTQIDYKSLGVRHLGSIYEGLLEFRLRLATRKMVVVKGKKTEEIIPLSEASETKRVILRRGRGKDDPYRGYDVGEVYLENDRRERKATGSYYTPDYIVKYIVAQTVGPVLDEKFEALRPQFARAELTLRTMQSRQRALSQQRSTSTQAPETEAYNVHRDLNSAFFNIKVLDPAMGSGHFLVEAVDYITDRMTKFLAGFPWNPVVEALAETRKTIQRAMERQEVSIDPERLTDINLLKRQVLKSCIYGVDVNQMAVELAKVSVWLDSFTLGAPLSFLDHHLKWGNSLIGGDVQEAQQALAKSLWGHKFARLFDAANLMRRLSEQADNTFADVVQSREMFRDADRAIAPFKQLMNVWISEYFGAKGAQTTIQVYGDDIIEGTYGNRVNQKDREAITFAQALAARKHFFHWELEFPEVFCDAEGRKPNGGFDAVVGNPPYVRQEGLGDDKPAFKVMYRVFNSIADLYTYFIERGHKMLHQDGRFGMITANKFMRANYGAALRTYLTKEVRLEQLVDFGELRVFGDAATDPMITISSNNPPRTSIEYVQLKSLDFESLDSVVKANAIILFEKALSGSNWSLATDRTQELLDKLRTKGLPLGKYVEGRIRRGILTGFNEAFIIDRNTRDKLIEEDYKSGEIIKPFLIGDDVRKYTYNSQQRYLIWTYVGIPIATYPAIYKYLQRYQIPLEKRWDKGNHWWELRHCDYYLEFEKPKIIYPEIAMSSRFTLDEAGYFSNKTTFIIPYNNQYLLAILNSKLIWFVLKRTCASLGDVDKGGRLNLQTIYVESIPIRRISFTTPSVERAQLVQAATSHYHACIASGDWEPLLAFVRQQIAREPEAADVVHDLLAWLAEEMLRLNREKRAEQKDFLGWLTGAFGMQPQPDKDGRVGIEALTGKARLLDYAGDYQKGEAHLAYEEVEEILRRNRNRLQVSPNDPVPWSRLRARYQASLDIVLPLKQRLERTDALIDKIVYRLYGLTEEEERIVSG
ncbi:MAG: BREX-1 system adenine-specific DNA-methyltransferase PglX [Chloroflexota bacterium]|nr:BREX-1 system adenine-specific DNA-methyltransferase PglX [Chloroflexota bacterium]